MAQMDGLPAPGTLHLPGTRARLPVPSRGPVCFRPSAILCTQPWADLPPGLLSTFEHCGEQSASWHQELC